MLSIDQGTTSTRCILFDKDGHVHFLKQQEFRQAYPQPGRVEHDPEERWSATRHLVKDALHRGHESGHRVSAQFRLADAGTTVALAGVAGIMRPISKPVRSRREQPASTIYRTR
ncbi:MAG: FGGY family carbohydrate kinase [Sedimenticola sp.]|nr:FGGY family carbohydrate kinase [Sedimenticola sp.]